MSAILVVLRHGRAEYQKGDLIPEGREEARQRASAFGEFDAVYSSPSPRALHTAEIVSGTEVQTDDRLDVMVPRHLRPEVAERMQKEGWSWTRATFSLPEALDAVSRGIPLFALALVEIAADHNGQTVLVVVHENHLAGLLAYHDGEELSEESWEGREFGTTHGVVLKSTCGRLRLVCRI